MNNKLYPLIAFIAIVALVVTAQTGGQQKQTQPQPHDMNGCPMHDEHTGQKDHAVMNARGDERMGFAQAQTTHHFRLTKDGGQIEVAANDVQDTASRDQIRAHLKHIAAAFAAGDFAIPMFVHDQTPPGVPAMQRLKAAISYTYEDTPRGGRVRITSSNADATTAVHEFLTFQIKEHETGDALEVVNQ
ncbi:MAG: hypothetical protein ACJ74W_12225 [Pyrinomonadaceae bacterium]